MKSIRILFSSIIFSLIFLPLFSQEFYFENPQKFSDSSRAYYPLSVESGKKSENAVFFEEADPVNSKINIFVRTSSDGYTWEEKKLIAVSDLYAAELPCIYSCAYSQSSYALAYLKNESTIAVITSSDCFKTTSETLLEHKDSSYVAPRIFNAGSYGFILFVTQSKGDAFSIRYSVSKNARNWPAFSSINTQSLPQVTNPLSPSFAAGKDSFTLVFTAQYHRDNLISLQLFSSTSRDGGKTWTAPALLTGETSVEAGEAFYGFSNQSACLYHDGKAFHAAWERSPVSYSNSDIYHAILDSEGKIKGTVEKVSTTGFAVRPVLFQYKKAVHLTWFTNQAGNKKVYVSRFNSSVWNEPLAVSTLSTVYPGPVLSRDGNELSFIWQKEFGGSKTSSVEILLSDHSTLPPSVTGENFQNAQRGSETSLSARIASSKDSSGVKGFSWIFTDDINRQPPEKINASPSQNIITGNVKKDGTCYFKVRQCDFAGNWSEPSVIEYESDTTPPAKVSLDELEYDRDVLLKSNTFTVRWESSSSDDDIAGYSYTLKKIDELPYQLTNNIYHPLRIDEDQVKDKLDELLDKNETALREVVMPASKINSLTNEVSFRNIRNGLYVFSVTAIDSSGNKCQEPESTYFVTNRYVPSTYITEINTATDVFGETSFEITGGGFTYDGKITAIYLDADGKEPYEKSFFLDSGDYRIISNSRIAEFNARNLNSGTYNIVLYHSDRGFYRDTGHVITIEEYGSIKQKVKILIKPLWEFFTDSTGTELNVTRLIIAVILIFALAGIINSSKSIISILKETRLVKIEVKALIQGDTMPEEKKSKALIYKKKGISLKSKLIMNTTLLIAVMDILIFIAFGIYMTSSQERTLSSGLSERSNVMLSSLSRSARIYLPVVRKDDALSIMDLNDSASLVTALKESRYAMITGYTSDEKEESLDVIWAATDENISDLTDTQAFIPGESRLKDDSLCSTLENFLQINETVTSRSEQINARLKELMEGLLKLAGKTDEKSDLQRQQLIAERNALIARLDAILQEIADENVISIPHFDPEKISENTPEYTFIRPVLYRQESGSNFVHGAVIIKVSTEDLIQELKTMRFIIFRTGIIIILIAILIGIASTYQIASRIVKPVNILVEHLAMIRDTKDKETLAGKNVSIHSGDEIEMLGDTVNQMTEGLAEAAVQSKNLTFGKEVQAKFLPLQVNEKGEVKTTGSLESKGADFFSYYAGADDLSGDYYDYHRIDDEHFAIIKCDVSGHGVPAALIMVEVATLFLSYFSHWNMKDPKQGTNLSPVVSHINDLLESRGFKGRFAAFTLCIMNVKTGCCWFCNAGDNAVQIYDGTERKKKTIMLQQTPAAGMFTSDLIDMKGGYLVSKIQLKKDDVLFLYTDGIEEAKRIISHTGDGEKDSEELSAEIVTEIIESVYQGRNFTLKRNNEGKEEELHFDFSTCSLSGEDAVTALVSVEKAFRLYKSPSPKATDRVKTDRKIDSFLHEHFKEYSIYCSDRISNDEDLNNVYYRGVLEDPQYDDLTLVAIKKN